MKLVSEDLEEMAKIVKLLDVAIENDLLTAVIYTSLKEMQLNVAITPLMAIKSAMVEWDCQ